MKFSRRELAQRATLTETDLVEVGRRRRPYNQLGFAYQLGFVRLMNRFPAQVPFELIDDLVLYTALQLQLDPSLIEEYHTWQSTLSRHQQQIVEFLGLRRFNASGRCELEEFVFEAATRLAYLLLAETRRGVSRRAEDPSTRRLHPRLPRWRAAPTSPRPTLWSSGHSDPGEGGRQA